MTVTGSELVGVIGVGVVLVEGRPGTSQAFTDADRAAVGVGVLRAEQLLARMSQAYSPNGFLQCSFLNEYRSVVIDPGPIPDPTDTRGDRRRRDAEIADRRDRWLPFALQELGYSTTASYCTDNLLRKDWLVPTKPRRGIALFVTKFPMGWSAHAEGAGGFAAYIQYDWEASTGPFLGTGVSGSGIQNLDRTIAHEFGHLFGGLDEYLSAPCTTTSTSGPRPTTNANCGGSELCLMKGNSPVLCPATVEHFGWVDLDGDGTVDAAPPVITQLSPSTGTAGDTINVEGIHLGDALSVDLLGIGSADFTIVSDRQLRITIPDGDGDRDVNVTTPLGVTFTGATFSYL